MGKKYTAEDVRDMVKKAMENPETLYKRAFDKKGPFVNYTGTTSDTRESYTEIIVKELLKEENIEMLERIPSVPRETTYKMPGRKKPSEEVLKGKSSEKWIAKYLFGENLRELGIIIDYQTPLKKAQQDPWGEIDLLSYNKDTNRMFIIELKEPNSKETLLRCVLEIYTYSKQVVAHKLISDFGKPSDTVLRKAVLVFGSSHAHENYYSDDYKNVRELMEKLNVEFFKLDDKYILQSKAGG